MSTNRSQRDPNAGIGSMLAAVLDKLSVINKSVKLERSDGKVRVVFEDDTKSTEPAPTALDATLNRMRDELKELLGRCQGAREVLMHLATLEQTLRTQGLAAFDNLPPRVLKRAGAQLESIVGEPVGAGIADLRSRISVALTLHEKVEQITQRSAGPSSFLVDEKLQVSEASASDFMRAVETSKRGL
ncbi:MAG: hypothetical protein WA210_24545 [Burkholderiaceae bacterium]